MKKAQPKHTELQTWCKETAEHRVQVGTRPSDVTRAVSMATPLTGRWNEDLLLQMHMKDERREANESLHPITVKYG